MVYALSILIAAGGCASSGYDRPKGSAAGPGGGAAGNQAAADANLMRQPDRADVASSSDQERTQALLQKALAAMGGASTIDGLRTLVLKGTLRQRSDAGALALPVTTTFVYPDRMRRDVTLGNGTRMSTVFAGDDAFLLGSFGAIDYSPEEKAALEASVRANPLVLLKARNDPTFRAIASGSTTAPSGKLDVLRITLRGRIAHLELDDAGRIVGLIAEGKLPGGETVPGGTRVRYSDFRPAGGLIYPFVAEGVAGNGQDYTIRLESVLPNEPVPPTLFDRPAVGGNAPR